MKKINFFIAIWFHVSSYAISPQGSLYNANHDCIHKVLLVVAMNAESAAIIKEFGLHKELNFFPKLPMKAYIGKQGSLDILLVENGEDPVNKVQNIGTQASTLSTYLGVEYFNPDFIISIGTAGGVKKTGARIGDVYVSKKIYFFERRISVLNFYKYGIGDFQSPSLKLIMGDENLKTGIVCSGDSYDNGAADYQMIDKLRCNALDMEAAGVAWVSMLTKIPMVAIKGITDYSNDKHNYQQFKVHFSEVTKNLAVKLKVILGHLERIPSSALMSATKKE